MAAVAYNAAMAIDIDTEDLLTLKAACRHPALAKDGKPLHLASMYRYVHRGCRGVKLETIRTPAGLKTSRQAIVRFVERLSGRRQAPVPTASACAEAHRQAEAVLAAQGI